MFWRKKKKKDSKTLFMLTSKQFKALDPLFNEVIADNKLGKVGAILLQPLADGRVRGGYIVEEKAKLINEILHQ